MTELVGQAGAEAIARTRTEAYEGDEDQAGSRGPTNREVARGLASFR